ncbi:MAG: FtsH protease activity modulator HflK [Planctomycetes bacterium]|nr:FtsH protease activity modulator HflK [Planctomycetota bacterium]
MTQSRAMFVTGRVLGVLFWLGLIGYAVGGGVFTVAQSEVALIYRCGAFVRLAPPGMHFAWPPPIERIVRIPTETLRMPVGFSLNDRIRNLLPTETESQWLTGDTNIVELQAVVNYSLHDPRKSLASLNELVPGPTAAQLGLRSFVIRVAVETAFSELASGMSIDELISGGKTQLQLDALARAQAFLDRIDSGILLTQVNITDANPPVAAREAFTDVQSAKAERERRISEADGYRRTTLPDAQAESERQYQNAAKYASETISEATGEAKRFTTLLEEVSKNRDLAKRRLWLDAMTRILAKGEKIFYEPTADGTSVRVWLEK